MKKKRIIGILAVVLIVSIAVGGGFLFTRNQPKALIPSKKNDITLIAHRGLSGIAPENTLPAFQQAGGHGFWGAECDVHYTSDGKWMALHNDSVNSMTNGRGTIIDLSSEELKKLTINNGNGIRNYPDTKIPSLEEYLSVCKEFDMTACIEIKDARVDRAALQILYQTAASSGVPFLFMSFTYEQLEIMREFNPDMELWFLYKKELTDEVILQTAALGNARLNFKATKDVTKEMVEKCTVAHIGVACWTVDDLETLQRFYAYGVRTFTTNVIIPSA